ncbi:unnamed protein product [Didymodactylos carnosus]|uniref:Uncharacterized protein n=1 Tax=Didymodactylos carnosus TaxID=1234261 RepID=A0A815K077_9BILA|nr:unnamed protein product [Didymodactylos carnosus]CAF4281158.1 unnamed protein product [Didymodactylos carnosus]
MALFTSFVTNLANNSASLPVTTAQVIDNLVPSSSTTQPSKVLSSSASDHRTSQGSSFDLWDDDDESLSVHPPKRPCVRVHQTTTSAPNRVKPTPPYSTKQSARSIKESSTNSRISFGPAQSQDNDDDIILTRSHSNVSTTTATSTTPMSRKRTSNSEFYKYPVILLSIFQIKFFIKF